MTKSLKMAESSAIAKNDGITLALNNGHVIWLPLKKSEFAAEWAKEIKLENGYQIIYHPCTGYINTGQLQWIMQEIISWPIQSQGTGLHLSRQALGAIEIEIYQQKLVGCFVDIEDEGVIEAVRHSHSYIERNDSFGIDMGSRYEIR